MTAKVRPCLALSVAIADGDRALVTFVPHTTSTRATPYEAAISTAFLKAGAFDAQGLVTVPATRVVRQLGMLRPDDMATVERCVCRWLGLRCEA